MKQLRAIKLLLPMLLVAFTITQCDIQDSNVGTLDDATEKVPNFTVMPGAENVTVKVDRNNDRGYFNVNLSNVGLESEILEGNYLGWCAHWSAPINTSGEEYNGVTLYSTRNDKNWNKLNYVLNNRVNYFNNIDGVTYKEMQAAIWSLIDFKEFDIDENQIFDNLNRAAFDAIMNDVKANGDSFQHGPGTAHAVFADMSVYETSGEPTQTVIIVNDGTAWGGDSDGEGTRFYNFFDMKGSSTQGIYVGSKLDLIGYVTITPNSDKVTISLSFINNWQLEDDEKSVKIQGINDEAPIGWLPPELAPGQFDTYGGDEVEIEVDIYEFYLIHLDVVQVE